MEMSQQQYDFFISCFGVLIVICYAGVILMPEAREFYRDVYNYWRERWQARKAK